MMGVQSQQRQLVFVFMLAVFIWLPRGVGLDRYATADENAWLTRSANFYRALAQGDWAGTFQRHHPGVTVTWAGTLGFLTTYPGYVDDTTQDFGWLAEELTPFLREHGHEPIDLLAAGRQMVVLSITLLLALAFLFSARRWGLWPALAGNLLLAFDPFHIAHSRLMHLDGLLSSTMLLAMVALLVGLDQRENPRWRWGALMTSGVATGLAVLTRSPGIFLVPFAAFMGVVLWGRVAWQRWRGRKGDTVTLGATSFFLMKLLLLWLAVATATFYLLWPAMWVAPLETVRAVFSAATAYAEAGHDDPIFFNGMIYNGDPGSWFYPVTLLWRTTPLVWLGVVLAVGSWGFLRQEQGEARQGEARQGEARQGEARQGEARLETLLVLLFGLGFWLLMNAGAKKFDRYLLPIYPMVDLVAGVGLVTVGGWAVRHWVPRFHRYAMPALVALVVLTQAAFALPHFPYYLTYYNPALGGGEAAVNVMQIGRGEGANLAAEYLNRQSPIGNRESPTVASAFPNGPFSYFYTGRTVPPTYWSLADYAVLYTQDLQRQLPSARYVAWLAAQEPLTAIILHDTPYASVYDLATAPTPPFVTTWAEAEHAQIRLNAYELTAGAVAPGSKLQTILYLENLAPIENDLNILVRLVGADGSELARDEGWPWGAATSAWGMGAIWPDGHALTIPTNATPGYYRLEVGFYDPETQAQLQATQALRSTELPALVTLDYIQVGALPLAPAVPLAEPYQVGELATLLGYSTETSTGRQIDIGRVPLLPGEDLHLSLYWQIDEGTATDYTTFIHVIDANGTLLTQQDAQPAVPTSLWHQGQLLIDTYTLTIPDGAALGEYPIVVGLYDLASATRLPVWQGGEVRGDSIPLTRVVVALSRMGEVAE